VENQCAWAILGEIQLAGTVFTRMQHKQNRLHVAWAQLAFIQAAVPGCCWLMFLRQFLHAFDSEQNDITADQSRASRMKQRRSESSK
jgi:hypothetical protein